MSQTLSPDSPSLGSNTRSKIPFHIQNYFIYASKKKKMEKTTEETEWILVSNQWNSLLQNEAFLFLYLKGFLGYPQL